MKSVCAVSSMVNFDTIHLRVQIYYRTRRNVQTQLSSRCCVKYPFQAQTYRAISPVNLSLERLLIFQLKLCPHTPISRYFILCSLLCGERVFRCHFSVIYCTSHYNLTNQLIGEWYSIQVTVNEINDVKANNTTACILELIVHI